MFWDKTLQKRITELRYVFISQKLNKRLLFEKGSTLSSLFHPKKVDVEGVCYCFSVDALFKQKIYDWSSKKWCIKFCYAFLEVLSQNIWPIIRFMLFCPKTLCFTVLKAEKSHITIRLKRVAFLKFRTATVLLGKIIHAL